MENFIGTIVGGFFSIPVFLLFIIADKFFGYSDIRPVDSFVLGLLVIVISITIDLIILYAKNNNILEYAYKLHVKNLFEEFYIIEKNHYDKPDVIYKFKTLLDELEYLKRGIVKVRLRDEVYEIDKRILKSLGQGENFFATVPIVSSIEETNIYLKAQFDSFFFKKYIDEQSLAVRRGVHVERLYMFNKREEFDSQESKKHFHDLHQRGIIIKYVILDEIDKADRRRFQNYDFIIFGNRRFSVGEPGSTLSLMPTKYDTDEAERKKLLKIWEQLCFVSTIYRPVQNINEGRKSVRYNLDL